MATIRNYNVWIMGGAEGVRENRRALSSGRAEGVP